MSYTLYISPIEAMQAIKAGGDWEDVENVLLESAARERLLMRLEKYGYQLAHERHGVREYEKAFKGQPVRVHVYDTEIAFSASYWERLNDILFDLRMEIMELADSPRLAFYDPQQDEWISGE
ncbi:hypothetical protein [Deinococcus phoenicis]|uniref:hypothetical protein n=1 Tax=Deinococcus phoenicis TaxID=1476583 RepID=UPI00126786E3|nr:hypothetical protein [Deinococcus phoenicis]